MDRSHLLNDAFSLAESGHLDYSIPMSMIRYLKKETDYVPWSAAVSVLEAVADKLEGTEAYPKFRQVKQQESSSFDGVLSGNVEVKGHFCHLTLIL